MIFSSRDPNDSLHFPPQAEQATVIRNQLASGRLERFLDIESFVTYV